MSDPQIEELAALHAVGLLEGPELKTLLSAAEQDPEVRELISAFSQSAAFLAYDLPQAVPPSSVRRELMAKLKPRQSARIIAFPQWIPYALAACLMGLAIVQAVRITDLRSRLRATRGEIVALQKQNDMTELKLASLQAKDAAYSSAKVMVAWDPKLHKGVISMDDMPAPPPGHDYQLWVLDPQASGPVSAGVLSPHRKMEDFAVRPVSTEGPGFAISLEPSGGRPAPTGAILFAVAPGL